AVAVSGTAALAALAVITSAIVVRPAPSRHTRPVSSPTRSATSPARPTQIIDAPAYAVSYRVPADWTATPDQGKGQGAAEDGESGFVVMNATGAPGSSLQTTCHGQAGDNGPRPDGTSPATPTTLTSGPPRS